MKRACQQCGTSLAMRHPHAQFCQPCSFERGRRKISDPDRKRVGDYSRPRINGVFVCIDCQAPVPMPYSGKGCPSQRCDPCATKRYNQLTHLSGRSKAAAAVTLAIRHGRLKRPTEYACVDCGKPAQQYDHRDYGQPLLVDPVCRACNIMRGPAIPASPAASATTSTSNGNYIVYSLLIYKAYFPHKIILDSLSDICNYSFAG